MATMEKTVALKAVKPAPAIEIRESIEAQVIAFLQADDEIQKIVKGVSGQVYGLSRQTTISKKR